MKNKVQNFLIAVLVVIAGFGLLRNWQAQPTEASNTYGNDYYSTTTRAAVTGSPLAGVTILRVGVGSLGSVVITGANTGIINIYDGTTTLGHADSATNTLATFPASTAAGTYTLDIGYTKGLIIDIPAGLAPTSTITYR